MNEGDRNCDCEYWKANLPKLNNIAVMMSIHGMGYDGELFTYCPFCGKKLTEKPDE